MLEKTNDKKLNADLQDNRKKWSQPLLTQLNISATQAKTASGNDGASQFCPNNDCQFDDAS